jgi:hypothetical protein
MFPRAVLPWKVLWVGYRGLLSLHGSQGYQNTKNLVSCEVAILAPSGFRSATPTPQGEMAMLQANIHGALRVVEQK